MFTSNHKRSSKKHFITGKSSPTRSARATMIEQLEPRTLLSGNGLLGLPVDVPLISYNSSGLQTYNAAGQTLTVSATAISFRQDQSLPPFLDPTFANGLFDFSVKIDNSGQLIGGVSGDDLTISGDITIGGTPYSGSLLTGEILDYGYQDNGPNTTSAFEYVFQITGGQLASFYSGKDFDVLLSAEPLASLPAGFSGFSSDFTTVAKGTAGATPVLPSASLGDFVWLDDGNGIQDFGEAGAPNVTVNLYGDLNDDGLIDTNTELLATTTTADGTGSNPVGFYQFTGLTPGVQYQVEFVKPLSYDFTDALQGTDTTTDSDADMTTGLSGMVTLTPGEHNPTIDAGLVLGGGNQGLPVQLGDYVWLDTANSSHDINGIQNADESGIANVTVELLDVGGNVITTTTNSTGYYLFDNLPAGTYSTRIAASNFDTGGALAGLTATIQQAGTDSALDSDGDLTTHTSQQVTLFDGGIDLTLDFGFFNTNCGYEGLTPGYWKQSQHFDDWVGYQTTDSFNAIFGVTSSNNPTLLQALGAKGGGEFALERHAAAALLNAANPDVNYQYTTAQIIAMVQQAYATGDFESAKNVLAAANELELNNCGRTTSTDHGSSGSGCQTSHHSGDHSHDYTYGSHDNHHGSDGKNHSNDKNNSAGKDCSSDKNNSGGKHQSKGNSKSGNCGKN
ncbi:MAG: SdrD B-like domain-containing protein [Phycisphaerales bacterium]